MAKVFRNYSALGENTVGMERDGQPVWRGWGNVVFGDVYNPLLNPMLPTVPHHVSYSLRVVLKSFCVLEHGGTVCAGGCSRLSGVRPKWPTCHLSAQPLALSHHQ